MFQLLKIDVLLLIHLLFCVEQERHEAVCVVRPGGPRHARHARHVRFVGTSSFSLPIVVVACHVVGVDILHGGPIKLILLF